MVVSSLDPKVTSPVSQIGPADPPELTAVAALRAPLTCLCGVPYPHLTVCVWRAGLRLLLMASQRGTMGPRPLSPPVRVTPPLMVGTCVFYLGVHYNLCLRRGFCARTFFREGQRTAGLVSLVSQTPLPGSSVPWSPSCPAFVLTCIVVSVLRPGDLCPAVCQWGVLSQSLSPGGL